MAEVGLRSPGVAPEEVAPEFDARDVDAHIGHRQVEHEAFHLAQARPQAQGLRQGFGRGVRHKAAHALAVFVPLLPAQAVHEIARAVEPGGEHDTVAQLRERARVHEQHALVEELDVAVVGREVQVRREAAAGLLGGGLGRAGGSGGEGHREVS